MKYFKNMQNPAKLTLLLLLVTAFPAFADTGNDDAIEYLRILLGDIVDLMYEFTVNPGSAPDTVMAMLIKYFNEGLIVLATIGILYVGGVMFLSTAHEGQVDARKYDTVMLPLRFIVILSFLAPVSYGFNTWQTMVIFGAGQGLAPANKMAEEAVEFVGKQGTVIKVPNYEDHELFLFNVLSSMVCMKGFNTATNYRNIDDIPTKNIVGSGSVDVSLGVSYVSLYRNSIFSNVDDFFTPGESKTRFDNVIVCGDYAVDYSVEKVGSDAFDDLRMDYVSELATITSDVVQELDLLANSIVAFASDQTVSPPDVELFANILANFEEDHSALISSVGKRAYNLYASNSDLASFGQSPEERVKQHGFTHYGALYWRWSRISRITHDTVFGVRLKSNTEFDPSIVSNPDMKIYFAALDKYLNEDRIIKTNDGLIDSRELKPLYSSPVPTNPSNDEFDDLEALGQDSESQYERINRNVEELYSSMFNLALDAGGDPLQITAAFGSRLLTVAEVMASVRIAAKMLEGYVNNTIGALSQHKLTGIISVKLSPLQTLLGELTGLLVLIIACLLGIGFLAAIYLPLNPLIHWIFGIISYYFALLEAVVLAPLLALANVTSQGGLISEKSKAGIMLILVVVLKPMLLVIGFTAGLLLTSIGGLLLISLYPLVVVEISQQSSSIIFINFAIALGFIMLMISITQRCFAMTHELPSRVLKMLGGGQESFGEGQAVSATESGFQTSGGSIQEIGGGTIKGVK